MSENQPNPGSLEAFDGCQNRALVPSQLDGIAAFWLGKDHPAVEVVCLAYPFGSGEIVKADAQKIQRAETRNALAGKLGCSTCVYRDTPHMPREFTATTAADGTLIVTSTFMRSSLET